MGGAAAPVGQYPFFAWWEYNSCGATLIAPDILLTAAHCHIPAGKDNIYGHAVILGSQGNARNGPGTLDVQVVDGFVHPQWNFDYYREPEYDYMILKLAEAVPAQIAKPVAVNANPQLPQHTDASAFNTNWMHVIGMGETLDKNVPKHETLQLVRLPYISHAQCLEYWGKLTTINDSVELCYLHPQKGYDSCFGDSGGPLLLPKPQSQQPQTSQTQQPQTSQQTQPPLQSNANTMSLVATTAKTTTSKQQQNSSFSLQNNTNDNTNDNIDDNYYDDNYIQVGVVSWGDDGCAQGGIPSIASRVSAVYESWILPQICRLSTQPPPGNVCQDMPVTLPMSLRVEIFTSSTTAPPTTTTTNTLSPPMPIPPNLTWGLYQINPPVILYEVEQGRVIIDRTSATSRSGGPNRIKDNDNDNDKDTRQQQQQQSPLSSSSPTPSPIPLFNNRDSFFFDNLEPGKYFFRWNPIETLVQEPTMTLDRVQVIQAGERITKTSTMHAFVDIDGTAIAMNNNNYQNADVARVIPSAQQNYYMDLTQTRPLSQIVLPVAQIWTHSYEGLTVDLTLEFFYDQNPKETAWELRRLDVVDILVDTGNAPDPVLQFVELGSVGRPGLVSTTFQVPAHANHDYQLRIWDQVGNGMMNTTTTSSSTTTTTNSGMMEDTTTTLTSGWVQLWAGYEKIYEFDGNFTYEHTYVFRL